MTCIMAVCLTVGQKSGKRFTVDVKRHAVGHIIPQLVALPSIPLLSNISLIVNGYTKK